MNNIKLYVDSISGGQKQGAVAAAAKAYQAAKQATDSASVGGVCAGSIAFVCSGKGKAKLPISASLGDLKVMAAIRCSGHLLSNQQKHFVAAVHNYTTMTAPPPQHRFRSPSSGPSQFNHPCAMAVDAAAGHIIMADSSNHQVVVLHTNDWSFMHSFSSKGSGPSQFKCPMGVAVEAQATSSSPTPTTI
ncbi:NHL repeat-containing protein, partial [Acanthamoeba castellanii str. Neff]